MGFLDKTVFARRLNKTNFFVLAIIAGVILCGLAISPSTFAEEVVDNYGLYTASDGARWEWEVVSDSENTTEPQKLNIMFYDKPTELTTVTVPSYSDITTVSGVTPTSDTYYVRNANQESQDTRFVNPDPARRTGGADVTVLDMTNTSKVQIMGVKPIINPETEVELIFGENMVIGDSNFLNGATVSIFAYYDVCYDMTTGKPIYQCIFRGGTLDGGRHRGSWVESSIPGFEDMSFTEKTTYTLEKFKETAPICSSEGNPIFCDHIETFEIRVSYNWLGNSGAFEGYKLKLTNLENVKYIGWYAFANTTLNNENLDLVINANQTLGKNAFAGANIVSVEYNANEVAAGAFMDCSSLTSIKLSENVSRIMPEAFANTTSLDIDFTFPDNVIAAEYGVFRGSAIKSVNLNNVKRTELESFKQSNVSSVTMGDDTTYIGHSSFESANITGELDLKNVKIVRAYAFRYNDIKSIDFGVVEDMENYAFAYNDLSEIYLPKTINIPGAGLFYANTNLKKATIAYDTLTGGTPMLFAVVLDSDHFDDYYDSDLNASSALEELVILAPYAQDEEVKESHISYDSYKWEGYVNSSGQGNSFGRADYGGYKGGGQGTSQAEIDYANVDNYKNIIAPMYFYMLNNLKNVTIGEGMEFIGSSAFYSVTRPCSGYCVDYPTYYGNLLAEEETPNHITLPETLRGIGNMAFASMYRSDMQINLPSKLEFIGVAAFRHTFSSMRGDVDLPNLRFLGDFAFYMTNIRDVYLHDSIEYMGVKVFSDCIYLHDITFDLDIFNPNKRYAISKHVSDSGGEQYFVFRKAFGEVWEKLSEDDRSTAEEYGAAFVKTPRGKDDRSLGFSYRYPQKLGTIKFTEKVQSELPTMDEWFGSTNYGGCYNSCVNYSFFSDIAAEKIDFGESGIKNIVPFMFQDSMVDEIVLPANTEKIGMYAFYNEVGGTIANLPDTITEIGDDAFYGGEIAKAGYEPLRVLNIPTGLETVGRAAFYRNKNVVGDLNAPNLRTIGEAAFLGTNLKSITLGNKLESIGYNAFIGIEGLKNLVIDCNIFDIAETRGRVKDILSIFNQDGTMVNDIIYDLPDETGERPLYEDGGRPEALLNIESIKITSNATAPIASGLSYSASYNIGHITEWVERWGDRYYSWSTDETVESETFPSSAFYGIIANEIDLSEAPWDSLPSRVFQNAKVKTIKLPAGLTTIPEYAFYGASVENPINLPEGITQVKTEAFQYSNVEFENAFAEGLIAIFPSAFYGADVRGDITIPESVQYIGLSAFNAGDADTHYNTVTIKPTLDYAITDNQAIFQMFWNAKMDKLVIESPMLPVLRASMENPILPEDIHDGEGNVVIPGHELREDGEPEFHGMTMKEVEVKNIYAITPNAFEECAELEKVVFSNNQYLDRIGKYAFNNATKLKQVVFGEVNNNKDINLEEYVFNNTAIESLGTTDDSGMNLAAANFYTVNEHVFSNMPSLTKVSIPNNFNIDENLANAEKNTNGSYITSFTFSDDPELNEVTIGYQVSEIRDGAFLNDEKLAKLFVWGNTEIQESDQLIQDFNNTTIPKGTNIFAYSDAPAEDYANAESRDNYDGKFYALDEVLYLTSNKVYVILNDDKTDFDKEGLKLYALRRDGVILESDWKDYKAAFKRTEKPAGLDIAFEEGRGALGDDTADIAKLVFDAPKPFTAISLANKNFENVTFDFMKIATITNPLVMVYYPDGYTGNIRQTTLATMTKEDLIEKIEEIVKEEDKKEEESKEEGKKEEPQQPAQAEEKQDDELAVPNTGALATLAGAAASSISIATIVVLGGIYIAKKCKN